MKRNLTNQSLFLILLQVVALLLLFCARFYYHSSPIEESAEAVVSHFSEGYGALFEGTIAEVSANLFNIEGTMPLEGIVDSIAVANPLLTAIIAAFIILGLGFGIVRILVFYMVSTPRNYLPALLYVIVSSSIFYSGAHLSTLLVAMLLLITSRGFVESFSHRDNFGILFSTGVLLGLTPLLHAQAIVYIVLIPIAIVLYKRSTRELIVTIVGALLPLLTVGYISWAVGGEFLGIFRRVWQILTAPAAESLLALPVELYVVAGVVIVGTLLSIFFWLTKAGMRNRARRLYRYMSWFLLLSIASATLSGVGRESLPIIAIPITFLLGYFYIQREGRLPLTLYLVTLLTVVAANIIPFLQLP